MILSSHFDKITILQFFFSKLIFFLVCLKDMQNEDRYS